MEALKKTVLLFLVILLPITLLFSGCFLNEDKGFDKIPPSGDQGLPDDYDKTLKSFSSGSRSLFTFPQTFNWNDLGVVTPAKNQGGCGSCWAFASTGAIESKILMLGGPLYDLSEQQQVSCNTSMSGCGGGNMASLQYWYTQLPKKEECTGYSGNGVSCSDMDDCNGIPFKTSGYYTVNTANITDVKMSLMSDGPTYFRYDFYTDFNTYWSTGAAGEVYTQTSGIRNGGHAILIIGWDDDRNAWLCKNSWGETQGPNDDGTFWMAYSGHTNNLNFGMANVDVVSTNVAFKPGQDRKMFTDDFNGDGRTDLVIVFDHFEDNLLHVQTLLSNSDGTWQAKKEQTIPWGLMCTDEKNILIDDFNGDGKKDIVFAFDHYQDNLLHVRTLISNGDGTWQVKPEQITPWGKMCTDEKNMLVKDFNGDGKTDIAIAFDH
ncbi:MAG: hypothetical protein GY754_35660, partial [bacterium]|nr:hypothetical protein [bacterium]